MKLFHARKEDIRKENNNKRKVNENGVPKKYHKKLYNK